MVDGARLFCSKKKRYRSTSVRLKAGCGSDQDQETNSSIACPQESCDVLAGRELRTACFDCSRWGIRRTFLLQRAFDLLCCFALPGGLLRRRISMRDQIVCWRNHAYGLEGRFWGVNRSKPNGYRSINESSSAREPSSDDNCRGRGKLEAGGVGLSSRVENTQLIDFWRRLIRKKFTNHDFPTRNTHTEIDRFTSLARMSSPARSLSNSPLDCRRTAGSQFLT